MTDLADFAARTGLSVFPCDAAKRPCVKGGFTAATRDKEEIRRMFSAAGVRLIGVPTGQENGIIVIDVDIKNGARGMEWLNANSSALPPTRTHKTRSGGLHLVFKAPPSEAIRNSASKIAPGVDVRGNGGYVIIPPSEGYAVADNAPPAEMPLWLIHACTQSARMESKTHSENHEGTKYGLAALDAECAMVRNATYGRQELTLNEAALKIGALVAGGQIDLSTAERALVSAASHMSSAPGERPWTTREVKEKIARGMRDGSTSPRAPREQPKPQRHTASVMLPQSMDQTQPPPNLLPFFTFADTAANLDVADFVEGLLVEGAMSVIYGESNSGKTFWTTDLALHVAAGMPWNGREVKQGAVIYCALEGAHGIRNRIAAFKQHYHLEDAEIPFVVIPVSINLLDPNADVEALVATIKAVAQRFETPSVLTIIDTLSRAMAGGNENASEDMGALVNTGDLIRQATATHLAWIHHSGKDTAKGARGHSLLRAATDTEIEISADGQQRQAEVRKQRDLEGGSVFCFTLKQITLGQNRRGKDVTSCVIQHVEGHQAAGAASGSKLTGHNKRALDVLNDLIAEVGQPGHGAPPGCMSVPDKWWRQRFYERAMPGDSDEAKQKAFRRAANILVEKLVVGVEKGRVWAIRPPTGQTGQTGHFAGQNSDNHYLSGGYDE